MPLSFNDAFMYDESALFPGFQQQPIYQSDLAVGQFSDLGTGPNWYLEKLLQNIKLYFPKQPNENKWVDEWVDEILLRLSEEGYGFDFIGLEVILSTYKKIDQSILYTCIESTVKELCPDDFDRLRIMFHGSYDYFSFFGYYPGAKGTAMLNKSLALLIKPNPTDTYKTVIDGVNEDVVGIGNKIKHHRGIHTDNEEGVYTDDSISIVSSLITGRVHLLVPISNRDNKSNQEQFSKPYEPLSDDNSDEIPF